jgi:hypothetical protein
MACQDDVKAADNRDFSMDSMMAFGAACEAIKNPPETSLTMASISPNCENSISVEASSILMYGGLVGVQLAPVEDMLISWSLSM